MKERLQVYSRFSEHGTAAGWWERDNQPEQPAQSRVEGWDWNVRKELRSRSQKGGVGTSTSGHLYLHPSSYSVHPAPARFWAPQPGSTHISKYLNDKESCSRWVKRDVLPIRLETKVFGDLKYSRIIFKSQPLSSLTYSAIWNIHIWIKINCA